MPAASYREGPDGHSSRKQNSKRRRAKCSPSFVSGRVIGHGDISPRCIPECSAMALHRAVPAARLSRASTLSFVLLTGGRSPSPAFGAVFFCGEGGSYLVRGESRRSSMARSSRMRSRATGSGNILARCVPERLSVARFRHGAFPGGNPWQFFRLMHLRGGFGRENRQFAARFARHASEMSWLWQDMRAMHPKSPANSCLGIHRAKILPGRGAFRCTGPSNHARRANLAIRRRRSALAPATPVPPTSAKPPERPRPRRRRTVRAARARSPGPRNTAQEAAPSSPPGQQVSPAAPAAPPPLFANTSQ